VSPIQHESGHFFIFSLFTILFFDWSSVGGFCIFGIYRRRFHYFVAYGVVLAVEVGDSGSIIGSVDVPATSGIGSGSGAGGVGGWLEY